MLHQTAVPKPTRSAALWLLPVLTMASAIAAAEGEIDTEFGANGTASVVVPYSSGATGRQVSTASGNKLMLVTNTFGGPSVYSGLAFTRLKEDGSLDTDFGNSETPGMAWTQLGSGVHWGAPGQISATIPDYGSRGSEHFTVVSYGGTAGTLAALFRTASSGTLTRTEIPPAPGLDRTRVAGIAHLSDGGAIVAGMDRLFFPSTSPEHVVLRRLNPDHQWSTSFGTGGFLQVDVSDGTLSVNEVAAGSGDTIYAIGRRVLSGGVEKVAIFRISADGIVDTTFANNATFALIDAYPAGGLERLAVQPDGKLLVLASELVAGSTDVACKISRLASNGTIDQTFDTDGVAIVATPGSTTHCRGIAVQGARRILIAGTRSSAQTTTAFVAGLHLGNGAIDPDFGIQGYTTHSGGDGSSITVDRKQRPIIATDDGDRVSAIRLTSDVLFTDGLEPW